MKTDANGNILCCSCGEPYGPASIGLTGICHPCYRQYVAEMRIRNEANAVLSMLPNRGGNHEHRY